MNEITDALIEEAWGMRLLGLYTMREIADRLGVNREHLIEAMNAWAKRQPTEGAQ